MGGDQLKTQKDTGRATLNSFWRTQEGKVHFHCDVSGGREHLGSAARKEDGSALFIPAAVGKW